MESQITALIPARGGSKGIINKNIIEFSGKPLIAWTIEFALQAELFKDVIVSTDSHEIAGVAQQYGAKVQIRPAQLASDTATALEVIKHAFKTYISTDNLAYLQPTSPFRLRPHLLEAMELLPEYDSVVSVMKVPHNMTPESIMLLNNDTITFYSPPDKRQFQRQEKQEYVARNGPSLLLTKRTTILDYNCLYGNKIGCVLMDSLHSIDIDTQEDLQIARALSAIL